MAEDHGFFRDCERSLAALEAEAGLVVGPRHWSCFETRALCWSYERRKALGGWGRGEVSRTIRLEAGDQASFLGRGIARKRRNGVGALLRHKPMP